MSYLQTKHYCLDLSTTEKFEYWISAINTQACNYCSNRFSQLATLSEEVEFEKIQPLSFSNFCAACQEHLIPEELYDELLIKVPHEYIEKSCEICSYVHVNTSFEYDLDFSLLRIDFENNTNAELIDALTIEIDRMRKKLGIPEPTVQVGPRPQKAEKYFKDIINNNVIPFLDLMLWELWCAGYSPERKEFLSDISIPLERSQNLQGNQLLDALYPPTDNTDDYDTKDTDLISKTRRSIKKTYLDINKLNNHLTLLRADTEYASR